jgi:hypothetical protein
MALGTMSAAGTYISLNGTALCMAEWTLRANPNLVDATTFCDTAVLSTPLAPVVAGAYQNSVWGGYSDSVPTVTDVFIEVKGYWNFNQKPHVTPYLIVAGRTMSTLVLGILNPVTGLAAAGPTYTFPVYIVDEVRTLAVVRDALKIEFTARNRGQFTYAQ